MTRVYRVRGDQKKKTPRATPLWEGMLEDGGMLYIPRGWWHVAVPLDEPTLHLTVGLHRPTGLDFVSWFANRLRSSVDVRDDLPRFGTSDEKEAYVARVRDAWEKSWRPGLLDEYFVEVDTQARSRPHFGLPWTARTDVLPPEDEGWSAKWLGARPWETGPRNGAPKVGRGNGQRVAL